MIQSHDGYPLSETQVRIRRALMWGMINDLQANGGSPFLRGVVGRPGLEAFTPIAVDEFISIAASKYGVFQLEKSEVQPVAEVIEAEQI